MSEPFDYSNLAGDFELITHGRGVFIQRHVPLAMNDPYHVHPSIEVNFLEECDMVYSFSGQVVNVPKSRFCVFWAAQPHRVTDVSGPGLITNAYISIQEFWSWPLPPDFVEALMSGAVLLASDVSPGDELLARRLSNERNIDHEATRRLHCLELQARLTRLALEGWNIIGEPTRVSATNRVGGNAIVHFEKMLRFIGQRYTDPIGLRDVADAASVSQNYANTLFKKILGTTVKAHITEVRVYRARMLLAETDDKILTVALDSGFRSLSSFYTAFQTLIGLSPAQFRKAIVKNPGLSTTTN